MFNEYMVALEINYYYYFISILAAILLLLPPLMLCRPRWCILAAASRPQSSPVQPSPAQQDQMLGPTSMALAYPRMYYEPELLSLISNFSHKSMDGDLERPSPSFLGRYRTTSTKKKKKGRKNFIYTCPLSATS